MKISGFVVLRLVGDNTNKGETVGNMDSFGVGLNWVITKTFDGKRKISLSGNTFAFSSYIAFYPDQDFGIVLLTNESDRYTQNRLGDIAENVYEESYYTMAQRSSDGFGFSPAINILLSALNKRGFNKAVEVENELKKSKPRFGLKEDELNTWAYALLAKGKKESALEIFKLNVSLYPQSYNAYDSLGEIYADMGNKELAIKNYKRSLELNPQNNNATEQLKKLE